MKKFLIIFVVACAALVLTPQTSAASGFNAGRIIDDSVFTNKSTMSVDAIQSFLNSKVTACDTNGSQQSEMNNSGVPDYNGSGSIQRWEWGKYKYNQTSFPCVRDYKQDGVSAAQLIYNAAQTYSINPQVLLVLLQKEQGLITDTWPLNLQYRSATGYGCPDTAACDSKYYGLKNQIDWASKMFRSILDNSPNWYTPYVLGNNYIQYNPNSSCGGSTVNIQNRSTQALYNYTPYQPNQAALDAGWGTANCGAYGNRNFYLYFTSWFGSTVSQPIYTWSPVSQQLYSDADRTVKLAYNVALAPGQKVYMRIQAKNTGNQTWQRSSMKLATTNSRDRSSPFQSDDWLSSNRVAYMLQQEVKPGEVATFEASFKAPQKQATHKEYFSLIAEGIAWLNDPGLYIPVSVQPAREFLLYADPTQTKQLNSADLSTYTGTTLYGKVRIINNTGTTLPGTTKLATTNPNDRQSAFQDSSWSSSNRIASLNRSLLHGEAGWFNFTITAPEVVGTYQELFGMVIDGTDGRWVESNTALLNANVTQRPSDSLLTNQKLNTGQSIISTNDRYTLASQTDGNMVIYKNTGNPIWASNTAGRGAAKLVMQDDGNLVAYTANGAIWASGTANR
ncbi:MAG: NBR1-Ig-like domain-containing protein [Candidatus Saccharimonadales bacterium]